MTASNESGYVTTQILPDTGFVTTDILPPNDYVYPTKETNLGCSTGTTPFQKRKLDKAIKKVLGGRMSPKDTSLEMVAKQIYMEDTFKTISEFYADILLEQDDLGANSIRIYTRNLESLTKVCAVLRNMETVVGRFTGVRVNFATRAGVWKKGLNILLRFDTVAEAFRGIALALDSGFRAQTVIPARLRALYGTAKCGTKPDKDPSEIPKTHTTDKTGKANSAGDAPKKDTSGETEGQEEGKSDYLATIKRFKKPKGKKLNPRAANYNPSVLGGQSVAFEGDYEYRFVENMMRESGEHYVCDSVYREEAGVYPSNQYYNNGYYQQNRYNQAFEYEASQRNGPVYYDNYGGSQYSDYHRGPPVNYEFLPESYNHAYPEGYPFAQESTVFEKRDPAQNSESKGSVSKAAQAGNKGEWKTTEIIADPAPVASFA